MFQISLEAARVNAKMTQQEASSAMNVNRSTIVNWENGRTTPDAAQFIQLCKIYGCPMDVISIPTESA